MYKKIAATVLLATVPLTASANWEAGLSYNTWDSDSVTLSTVTASIGYTLGAENEGFKFTPEIRYGVGIDDDNGLEVESTFGINLRGQYDFANNIYVYGSLGNLELHLDSDAGSGDGTDTIYGLGAGYYFSDLLGAELSFESYDEADVVSLGLRFRF